MVVSNAPADLGLESVTQMKVLIDRNIERNAVTHKTVLVSRTIRWGPHNHTVEVAERAYFPPGETERFRTEQLPYLATVCRFPRKLQLQFFSSDELLMEAVRQAGPSEGYLGINLFRDVTVTSVRCPAQRLIVFGSSGSIGITEEEQMDFFLAIEHPRFLQIRNAVGDAHIDDAFHLWTAEEAALEVFLTMDQRFWRVVNQKKKIINSAVLVMTPKELCEHLGAQPTDIEQLVADTNSFS